MAQALVWIYTLALTVIVVFAARRDAALDAGRAEGRLLLARAWVALIVLAQLRSPFLPLVYGNSAILLLLALLLPLERVRPALLGLIALGVVAYALILPLPFGPASSAFDYGFGQRLVRERSAIKSSGIVAECAQCLPAPHVRPRLLRAVASAHRAQHLSALRPRTRHAPVHRAGR